MKPTAATGSGEIARLHGLERTLVRIRWLGVALGVWQAVAFVPPSQPRIPGHLKLGAGLALGLFAAGNLFLTLWLRRPRGERALRTAGYAAFFADIAVLHALVWLYSFDEFSPTWVILYILTVEGAIRYELRGALFAVAAAAPLEIVRDAYRLEVYGFRWHVDFTTFRIGIMALIAVGTGVMASGLRRQREEAERRAILLEQLAVRESAARRELTALHEVLLAGVSPASLSEALQSMVDRIAADLGYETLTVLLLDPDDRLTAVASRASADDATARSQADAPIIIGGRVVGVLNVESPRPDAFGPEDHVRIERLTAQMALVIENSRLLALERQTVERMRELDQMKSDFVAITSHELRTPLTAMRGFIKTLQRPDLEVSAKELAEYLSILDRQSDKLARLVEEMLVMSRIDSGALQLQMAPCDIGEVLREMLHDLDAGAARVQLAVQADLPRMITDGQRLQQIARNLVENALKFSPQDAPVRLTAVYEGGELLVEVVDRGPGIPREEHERVFEMFHQVGGQMRRRGEGFGLGLHIAKRLAEALGGRIDLESEAGKGTTFRVAIPFAAVEDRPSSEIETA